MSYTIVHYLVISKVNTEYIATEHDTCYSQYFLAGVGRLEQVQQLPRLRQWRHWSWHQLEFPKHSLPVESRLGWLSPQQRLCDSESARLGSGAALQQFKDILDHDLFGCSCNFQLTVDRPASTGGRQMGLGRNPPSSLTSWAEAIFLLIV